MGEINREFRLVQKEWDEVDEFTLLDEETEGEENSDEMSDRVGDFCLIVGHPIDGKTENISLDPATMQISQKDGSIDIACAQFAARSHDGATPSDEHFCPTCDATQAPGRLFRRMILGAPFHLGTVIPTALQFSPKGSTPLERPHEGQRLITFTDSRQGTARMSVKLQQDAERNSLRSMVFHALLKTKRVKPDKVGPLEKECGYLEKFIAAGIDVEESTRKLADIKGQIEQSSEPVLSWTEMRNLLAKNEPDVSKWMYPYYRDIDRNTFNDNVGRLAEMLLAREFAHRPKRANSLETMGLVAIDYPSLALVKGVPA